MCGVVGTVSYAPVNQLIYDALLLLQHRGQDAAGIATNNGRAFTMHKANGLVRDVFRTRDMRSLMGNSGIGQVRYPTAGSSSAEEAQPFYVNAPFGITLAHNGNLTNWEQLRSEMFRNDLRHINTNSDSEVLLNVLAHEIQQSTSGYSLDPQALFTAVSQVHKRVRGSYGVVAQIAGLGLLAFRDPFGIRPLCIGFTESERGIEYMIASESAALFGMGFQFLRDVMPLVRREVPDFELVLAGDICKRIPDGPGIVRLGRVRDVRDAYLQAAMSLNPVRGGTGFCIKSLEAVAYGSPLVATPAGSRGSRAVGCGSAGARDQHRCAAVGAVRYATEPYYFGRSIAGGPLGRLGCVPGRLGTPVPPPNGEPNTLP